MLLSVNWLKDYLVKGDIKIDVEDLAEKLTMRGVAVANIKKAAGGLENVVVGRIEKISKHPNADRLQVTQVFTGSGELRQIVCGAKNIAEGDIVPVALPGAMLPGNFEIKISTIRGVESFGMICSGKELGLEEDTDGILQLPKHSHLGEPISRLLGHSQGAETDTIIEFELTPNRPDCLSVIGLAREIAPVLKTKVRDPKPARFKITPHRTSSIIKVEVDDPVLCPRYVARVIDGIRVTESPDWIKARLESVGLRPINNIVDITNFVMLEYGQPLHAFDLRRIESGTLRVAPCKEAAPFTLLNGETVQLQPGDILIQDGDRPTALAGIMGGANSQIEADTTAIVLESAAFLPQQIRRTAKRLGLISDASKRFEKGVDLNAVAAASERAAALLRDTVNANVYHPAIDTNEAGYKDEVIAVDMREIRKFTGMNLSAETVSDHLETIGVSSLKKSANVLSIRLPSHRLDLKDGVDIVEEVARLVGYDHIPETTPVLTCAYDRLDEGPFEYESRLKNTLSSMGLAETIHYSFTSAAVLERYGANLEGAISLKNPLSDEMKVMRTSLLPSLLETYKYNKNRKTQNQRLFELARCYFRDEAEETKAREVTYLSALFSGTAQKAHWKGKTPDVDFYFAKGLLESIVRQLSTVYLAYEPLKNHRLFHPARSASLKLGVREVGFIGEVHPFIRDYVLETTEPVVVFELNLDALKKYERTSLKYKAPSKFPGVELDLAFTLDRTVAANSILDAIKHTGGPLLSEVSVFDVYQGEHVGAGKKSMAFHLAFGSNDRTLQDDEVNSLKTKIIQTVSEKFSAQLRG